MSDALALKLISQCSTLIFDFDGVILDSNHIKEEGFRHLFKSYGEDNTRKIVEYHRANGGLSRYHKIRYFFNTLLGKPVDDDTVERLANQFSEITMRLLTAPELRIEDTIQFIKHMHLKKRMFIASASDEQDLKILCRHHGIETKFDGIFGSPKTKEAIVSDIIKSRDSNECVLIGDSLNDINAAQHNDIAFVGYNNYSLSKTYPYINQFVEAFKLTLA
ncbi:HAD family hydrolase [Gilvimarinus sp. 1_MG-2023]|uniref:HAD family hydrolase n=1 Tax=Gilvimarinus sp. 1_MG-2023 TaxID=3062638 RepID=UPI0026E3A3EC|nr:HAD-IA family hydrolase [Gilvimarinus sp. 1_MG-2023]MDO6746298.1 HAD-IA family hydrolase [Gilvimarinus sp. 1_MG-2023]